jgi:hypothetical protein
MLIESGREFNCSSRGCPLAGNQTTTHQAIHGGLRLRPCLSSGLMQESLQRPQQAMRRGDHAMAWQGESF